MAEKDEIAIVGVGCKFPGADNVAEYWRVLKNGENHVKEVPRNRWNVEAFYDPDRNAPGKTYVRTAGFVNSIDEWDHRFYGINDMEAELVDPQQRIVLDCVHMALEDGGITRSDIEGTQTGVYIGSMTDDYKGQVMDDSTISSAYSVTGTHNSIISARVSYTYNLSGPAMTIDTACSSSLVAIDVASQAILTGKCSMAVCGGVNILMDPQLFVALAKAGMLSPTGQCKTFTKYADGYARGEGCGIVILKSLKEAIKDGNKVWGTIKTGTNQDGHMAAPITAPSGLQQERLIKDIYERYNIDKAKIKVIEAHGTGTAIGDPTEANALGSHFGRKAKAPDDVYIGSVKTNIGHLEAAAGVAGIIKVLLMMKHGIIVPSLWYTKENENPKVKLSEHGFIVPTQCTPWTKEGIEMRLACVNSFGFGGTNAHAIVKEFEKPAQSQTSQKSSPLPNIIAVSAFDQTSLIENVQHMHNTLNSKIYDMRSLSYTSLCKRDHRPQRKAVFGKSQDDILAALNAYINLNEDSTPPPDQKKIVFIFCGVGTAWQGMCRTLMMFDRFKQAVYSVDKYLKPLAGWTISKKFAESSDILSDPMISHIAIFSCQVALCELWKSLNIEPDVVIGQSVGEVAAAYAAGYFDLQTAVRIIFYRSKFLAGAKSGQMAVIRNVDTGIVEACCKSCSAGTIAVYSSPNACTVSGSQQDIIKLKTEILSIENVKPDIIDIDVKCAYHSEHVALAAKQLAAELKTIKYTKGHIPVISTVTGQMETNGLFGTSNYWANNVRMPVLFSRAVKSLESKTTQNIFIEIGPSPVLRAHIGHIFTDGKTYHIMPSMQRDSEINTIAGTLCKLFELGLDPDWRTLFPDKCQMTDIPRYQFRKYRQLYQSHHAVRKNQGVSSSGDHMYIKQLPQKEDGAQLKVEIDEKTTPFVYQHIISGFIILPGATYADIGFEIASNMLGLLVRDAEVSLEFIRPVRIEKGVKAMLHISTAEQNNELLFHATHNQITMCKGWVRSVVSEPDFMDKVSIELLQLSISHEGCRRMSRDEIYDNLESLGFRYGPYFQLMTNCITNGTESLSEINVPEIVLKESETTTIHPSVLDVMMQSTINTSTEDIISKIKGENLSFLPVAIGKLRVLRKAEKHMFVFTKRTNTTLLDTVLQVHYNVLLINSNGLVVADLRNYTTYGKRNASNAPCELKYRLTWHPFNALYSEEKSVHILILTSQYIKDLENEFEELKNVTLFQNSENMPCENYIAEAFKGAFRSDKSGETIDAVLILFEDFGSVTDMTSSIAFDIFKNVKNNCMFLSELVKYMTNNSITCPLYIATQNSQTGSTCMSLPTINLVGGELWGFVRSIHLEFIHGEITLIDLRPSVRETKETLLEFIFHSCRNIEKTKPEIIIQSNKVYGAQFTKVPRNEVVSSLRAENMIGGRLATQQRVLALRSKNIGPLVLTAVPDIQEKQGRDYIKIRINNMCIHPLSIFPRTTSGINLDQDIWPETIKNGHNLFCLEFTGIQIASRELGGFSCRRPEGHVEDEDYRNRWQLLCIYPKEITTEMMVPKECTVSLKDIPFYRPGLILYAILSWRLAEYVPNRSSVVIYSRNRSSEHHVIFERILRSKKNVFIVDYANKVEDNGKWIDIYITLEKVDTSFVLLNRCKKIICLEESASDSYRMKVLRSEKQEIVSFSAAELLDKRFVSKCLPKVVSWLQKNYKVTANTHSVSISNDIDDPETTIPCRTVSVIANGKVVLPTRNPIDKLFSKTAVYVVTGGLTGLGWEIVLLIAEMGAAVIATMSRRDVTGEIEERITRTENSFGCKIICVKGDVADLTSVQKALNEVKQISKLPIRGIFHGAGVLRSKLLMNLEEADLDFVLKPKVIGTLNMHIATKEMNLDYFVVHSSISSVIGSPGQNSYGAANAFLDTFIEWRRRKGQAGQSINWGALSVGMASKPAFVENFSKRGFNLLSRLEIRSCFQEALMNNSTGIIYADVNWDICSKDYTNPKLERTRLQMMLLFDEAVSRAMNFDNDGIDSIPFDVKALQTAGKERQLMAIVQVIQKISSKVIGGDLSQVKMSSTLAELSFDSMSTVTFINIVQDVTGHRIAPVFMADTSHTLDDIVHLLQEKLFDSKDTSAQSEPVSQGSNGTQNGLLAIQAYTKDSMAPVDM